MKLKRFLALFVSVVMSASIFVGCGSSEPTDSTKTEPTATKSASGNTLPSAPVKVTFWHSMKGNIADQLKKMVNEYNSSEGTKKGITVDLIYQGEYDEASTKLSAILQANAANELPDIMQMSSKGIFDVKESKYIYPVQNFIDMDANGINLSELNANALHYAMYNGKVLGLPFSNSSVMLYYNKDMFKAAGLDPNKAPTTLEEMATYVKALTVKNGDKIKTFGLGTKTRFFLLGSWIPMQGSEKYMFDNADGRKGTPTAIAMTKDGTLDHFLTEWEKVLATGGVDFGVASPNEGFQSGLYAMMTASTSSMASIVSKIQNTGTFDVGVAELPRVDANSTKGTGIGGSALYVFDAGNDNKRLGAWDFMKYLATPKVSGDWFMNTGYYAMNSKAYDLPEVKTFLEKNPLYNIILKIADNSKEYPNYLEPWVPAFTDIDTTVQNEIIKLSEGSQDRATTISNIDKKVNMTLKDYLDANGK